MPFKSAAQRSFMYMHHPDIAKRWSNESTAKSIGNSGLKKTYRTGTPVAHKNMTLDPTGYVNREVNKGKLIQPSTRRSGAAKLGLKRAAARRLAARQKQPRPVGRSGGS